MSFKKICFFTVLLSLMGPLDELRSQSFQVKDKERDEGVRYCKVRVKGKRIAKVGNGSGMLVLTDSLLEKVEKGDSVKVTGPGYRAKWVDGKSFTELAEKEGGTIHLPPSGSGGGGVGAVPGYKKTQGSIGVSLANSTGSFSFGVDATLQGREIGSMMHVPRPFTELKTFRLYVAKGSKDQGRLVARLNIYDVDGKPGTDTAKVDTLVHRSLITFDIPMVKGEVSLDISNKGITVHDDILATIEILEKRFTGKKKLHLSSKAMGNGIYHKPIMDAPWKRYPSQNLRFQFKVKMPVQKKIWDLKEMVPEE
ncbi:MAG: hypothetical protein ABEH38_03025 [Flavobacteriales bacterium]